MNEFKVGGKARFKQTGEVFTVTGINTDPAGDEWHMEGWNRHGPFDIGSPNDVEPCKWEPPTRDEVAHRIALLLLGEEDGLDVHEVEALDDGSVAVLARWQGCPGGFRVRVSTWREDMS